MCRKLDYRECFLEIYHHGQGEAYNGMLWVEQDSSHGQSVTWQDDPSLGGKGSPGAPGMGEPLLNVSCESHLRCSAVLCSCAIR